MRKWKKRLQISITLGVAMAMFILTFSMLTIFSNAASTNLSAAKSKYKISNVIEVDKDGKTVSVADINDALSEARAMATASSKVIVHVSKGSYRTKKITVPQNVMLVAEDGVKFTASSSINELIHVNGSIYGGTYDGAYKAISVVYFGTYKFTGNNGIAEKVTVIKGKKEGIIAMHPGCRNSQVINCTTKNNKENGICIQKDAYMKLISGCNSSNNKYSGINISHANVGIIQKCSINNNGDKAISTNSDPVSGYKQAGCTIDTIKNCTIKGNKTNGVYIKPKCTLKSFTGNKLIGNKDGLVASAKTAKGTKGKSIIKNVSNNTFNGNKNSQICSGDKGAAIYIGSNNKIIKGRDSGIYIKNQGIVKISGKNNLISENKQAGISLSDKSKLYITGSNTKITKNGAKGIYAKAKAVATIKGVIFSGNKKGDKYAAGGARIIEKK